MNTFYANTKHGYVKRKSHNPYTSWCMVATKSYDGYLLATVSFHKAGNIQRLPSNAVYHEYGEVATQPKEGLVELRKKNSHPWGGHIVLPHL